MSEPFLAQVTMFAGTFAPRGWAYCSGQLLPISQNTAVFSLVGTTYGGDGETTFGLPDLRGRVPVGSEGNSAGPGLAAVRLGERGGVVQQTLTINQLPSHSHQPKAASEDAVSGNPNGKYCATSADNNFHGTGDENMGATSSVGNGQPVSILQPYLGINFIIALQGTFPSRN